MINIGYDLSHPAFEGINVPAGDLMPETLRDIVTYSGISGLYDMIKPECTFDEFQRWVLEEAKRWGQP
jgi:hypothetical protein